MDKLIGQALWAYLEHGDRNMSIQIIPERRKQSFGEKLGAGFANLGQEGPGIAQAFGQNIMRQQQQTRQSEAYRKLGLPEDFETLPLELQKTFAQNLLKGKEKTQEKVVPLKNALLRIDKMREIGKKNRLGRGSSVMGYFGGETAKDRGEYERLGKSLISYASSIRITNRPEFETLAGNLYNPSISDKEREGILDAMEMIISQNLQQYGEGEEMQQAQTPKERPPLSSFER